MNSTRAFPQDWDISGNIFQIMIFMALAVPEVLTLHVFGLYRSLNISKINLTIFTADEK
jgi:hypothetical protein